MPLKLSPVALEYPPGRPAHPPPILRLCRLQTGATRRDRAPPGRQLGGGRLSHRRRKIALLSIARPGARRGDAGGVAADRPDEGPDRLPWPRAASPAARLDSSSAGDECARPCDRCARASCKLLYVAPERFNNERFCATIQRTRIALFAVDEAHCISEWGHNFRPDYLKLADSRANLPRRAGAGADRHRHPAVVGDICAASTSHPAARSVTGFYRPNLTLRATPVDAAQHDEPCWPRLRQRARRARPSSTSPCSGRPSAWPRGWSAARLTAQALSRRHGGRTRTEMQEWWMARRAASSWPPSPSAWGSTRPTCAMSTTTIRPRAWRATARRSAAGRDGQAAICKMFCVPTT